MCRLLYQPPVALFTDINGLMTKYSSLCPKLSKYLDTRLPSVDVCDRERNRRGKSRNPVVSRAFAFTHPPTHTYTQSQDCRQGTAKYKGCTCLCVQNYQGKIECWSILSFIRVFRECSGPDGRKPGFCRASAGSNQTSLHLCRAALQAQIGALNTGMKVELFWP